MTETIDIANKKLKKSGVMYIQTVPPLFTVTKLREILSSYGEVGRIFLKVYILSSR